MCEHLGVVCIEMVVNIIIGQGGLVVMHSAASAKGPGFNSPVARAYLRFISWASTLAASSVGYALYGCNKL